MTMKVQPRTLLLIASVVWLVAGFNVLRIGLICYPGYVDALNLLGTAATFALFQFGIFGRLVKKHTLRVKAFGKVRQGFWRFFDGKTYLIMTVMITLGVSLRVFRLIPDHCIASFYTGLGASLALAGVAFARQYTIFSS